MPRRWATLAAVVALSACGAPPLDQADADGLADVADDPEDSAADPARDAAAEPALDAANAASDAPADAPRDAPLDAPRDAPLDAPRDAPLDAPRDAPLDAPRDAGIDALTDAASLRCPAEMTLVAGRVCVDRWEATLEEGSLDGGASPWSPFQNPGRRRVRAVSRPDVTPQGYISGEQAQAACREAGKRLCVLDEWLAACRGPMMFTWPYGMAYIARRCNEGRAVHPVVQFFGTATGVFTFENMNHPGINMQPDTVARTGAFSGCVSPWGAFDMAGNLHEWIADPNGTFKGGFYVDAVRNGPGCLYTTTAHAAAYHDYSTGFRCCADPTRAP
jgi:sulfatase modifying factor 1